MMQQVTAQNKKSALKNTFEITDEEPRFYCGTTQKTKQNTCMMTVKQAAAILEKYNKWRRGGCGIMPDPKQIGIAIDIIVAYIKKQQNPGK